MHRLDRPACGMVVLPAIQSAARLSEAGAYSYHAPYILCGSALRPAKIKGTLTDYLLKDKKTNTVRVVKEGTEGAKRAGTFL